MAAERTGVTKCAVGLSTRQTVLYSGKVLTRNRTAQAIAAAERDREKQRLELLQGTLDLLILRTLIFGRQHGQGIGRAIQQNSGDELLVEHGALYPALQRLEARGWISAEWGTSTNNRKARFYTLTKIGRKQLGL